MRVRLRVLKWAERSSRSLAYASSVFSAKPRSEARWSRNSWRMGCVLRNQTFFASCGERDLDEIAVVIAGRWWFNFHAAPLLPLAKHHLVAWAVAVAIEAEFVR